MTKPAKIPVRWRWLCVLWGAWVAGCSCGDPGQGDLDAPSAQDGGQVSKQQQPDASRVIGKEYVVRGVATLTFYPDDADDAREGAFGGYVLLYSKPQKTTLLFADMADDTCLSAKAIQTQKASDFAGLHSGDALTIAIQPYSWELPTTPMNPADQSKGSYYPVPSVEKMTYPYNTSLTIKGTGGKDIGPFALQLDTPSRLQLDAPKIKRSAGTDLALDKDLPLRWRFDGDVPYLSVRINQRDPKTQETISLSCRFANDGSATIPASKLRIFARDPEGKHTHIYFFSGNYQFFKLPEFEDPIMAVVEAITTSVVRYR